MGIRVLVASHTRLYREALGRVFEQSNDRTYARDPTTARNPGTPRAPGTSRDSGAPRDSGTQMILVGMAASAADAVEQVHRLAPDIALLDMAMSDAFSVARQLGRDGGTSRIVALGMAENEAEVLNCAQIGIAGYVTREASIAQMLDTVEATARGEVHCSPKIAGSLFRRIAALSTERPNGSTPNALTARESQILRLLQQGMSNKMICRSLGIELPTVKNHVHSILAKLGIHRRTEAISLHYGRAQQALDEPLTSDS